MTMLKSFRAACCLAVLSGAVYAMAYPPLGWGWLVIPGLGGLLLALRGQQGTRARVLGLLHGMTAYGLSLSWMVHIFGGLAVVLWCILAAFTVLFAEMQSRAEGRGIRGMKLAVFTALNWCGWEFIRAELFPLDFPWMTAGLGMGPNAFLPWVGVYGVSAVVMFCVVLLVMKRWKSAAAVVTLLILAVVMSSRCLEPGANDPLAVEIGGVQLEGVSMNEYLAGTKQLPPGIKHVVWPECAVPYDLRTNERDWSIIKNLCSERGITLTLGTKSIASDGDKWRNIALTVDPTGVCGEHTKVHTVHLFDDGTAGTSALPVPTNHGKVGTPICYDGDYDGVVRKMTAAGAEMFVIPTMDAESWTAKQHDQHAQLARIRACENGRWIFVCATSGVSQVIDSSGHVHARLAALQQGVLSGTLKRETKLSFYTRFGWLTP